MAISAVLDSDAREGLVLSSDYFKPRWYAAYTCANHEKRVREQLQQRSIESFLPLYETNRRWKDRTVRLQLPLFPGYTFLRIALRDRLSVLEIPSVVRLVCFNGRPAALPEEQIEKLKKALAGVVRAGPYPYLAVGRQVRINAGPLEGQEGILLRKKGNFRVVISIDLIQRSMIVDVDAADIEPVFSSRKVVQEPYVT
jgi:transcription antitermination factor NusG